MWVTCSSLSPGVHLFRIFLVDKCDGDKFGNEKEHRVLMLHYRVARCPKYQVTEVHALGFACDLWFGVFARPHGEEKGTNDNVRYYGRGHVEDGWVMSSFLRSRDVIAF
jgi:hypothetical protein